MLSELVVYRLTIKRIFPTGIIKNSGGYFQSVRGVYNHRPDRICSIVNPYNKSIIFGFDGNGMKLLLIQRAFEPELGKWSLMGGFVEPEESFERAASRVLKENCAANISPWQWRESKTRQIRHRRIS